MPSPPVPPSIDACVPGQAAGQHVRRRGVHRRRGQDRAVEPRGGAADGHRRRQRLPADAGARRCSTWPTRRGSRSPTADCPVLVAVAVGRAIAAAADDLRAERAGASRSIPTPFPSSPTTAPSQGAILLLHDASSEISLEQRCQSLHEKATRDPLTQVANRAEFDRVHEMFVERPPAAASPLQPADVRPGPLQVGQRHLRAPGGRRGDQEPGDPA